MSVKDQLNSSATTMDIGISFICKRFIHDMSVIFMGRCYLLILFRCLVLVCVVLSVKTLIFLAV